MKICPKCNKEHTLNGNFCSRACANSRMFTEESNEKRRIALKGKPVNRPPESPTARHARIEKLKLTRLRKYNNTAFDELGSKNRRRRVFEEQDYKCIHCGISEWFGYRIALELEHKDGNTENNTRENLEGRCPNCHSITATWRGRNKPSKNGVVDITDDVLLTYLKDSSNIRQGLLKAGLAAKGSNYARAKRLLGLEIE